MTQTVCFYHDPCRSCDGWAAAIGVWTYTKGDCKLIGLNYNTVMRDVDYVNKIVYMVDIVPNDVSSLYSVLLVCKELHIYDHHKGVSEGLERLQGWADLQRMSDKLHVVFDTQRSGARITWETLCNDRVPAVVYHIDDYDRHIHKYPTSKAVVEALKLIKKDPFVWQNEVFNVTQVSLVTKGNAVLDYQTTLVDSIVTQVRTGVVLDRLAAIVNCPYDLVDIVSERLVDKYPFVALYTDYAKQRKWSVRSKTKAEDTNPVTALMVAQHFGGNGHTNAAGFYTGLNTWIGE